ncbi:MAG TPA: class I SAM-dependent methyltransferase [Stellaceae bacterium]|jgi:SAM-dependent methyltransferase|nr:class I SAM-dependent methyltransferase [Stellaceae bacterium]
MAQNIYDNDEFFAGYARLPRSVAGLDAAPEWPALRALLPDLNGHRVLDLGCGYGWFCRWAREQKAADVRGIDVSEKMLARAIAITREPAIIYQRADLETIELPRDSFDLIYSSLVLHYIADLRRLMLQVYAALVAGGVLVFSVEHPIYTAPSEPKWVPSADGRPTWPVDCYLDEGPRSTDWLAKGVIKQHRSIGSYLNLLVHCGLVISHVEEWAPTEAQIAGQPNLADERHRPPFLIAAAQKPRA